MWRSRQCQNRSMEYTGMETVTHAIERLAAEGYTIEWSATEGALLYCAECDERADPAQVTVDETVRFEGASDPDDEVVVLAITAPSGRRGYFIAAYGPDMPPDAVAVVQALARH